MRYARFHSHELTTRTLAKVLLVAICRGQRRSMVHRRCHRNPPQTGSRRRRFRALDRSSRNQCSMLPAATVNNSGCVVTNDMRSSHWKQRAAVTATTICPPTLYTEHILRSHLTYYLTGLQAKSKCAVLSFVDTSSQPTAGLRQTVPQRRARFGVGACVSRRRLELHVRVSHQLGARRDFVVRCSGRYVGQSFSAMLPCSVADRSRRTGRRSLVA